MKISGHGFHCELRFSTPDVDDWMWTAVSIKASVFEGTFVCAVQRAEWRAFVDDLRSLETSIGRDAVATWRNMEANVEFRFALHRLGALDCGYSVSPDVIGRGPTLTGTFGADQSFLSGWIREAEQALEEAR